MTEATWDKSSTSPAIDWRMSVALENVPRGEAELAEVTSLESAVRAWLSLDAAHQNSAVLTMEHPVIIDGANHTSFTGDGIRQLAERLPGGSAEDNDDDGV
ncbi:hypothetical protein HNO88_003503 [Novosphingobium chloroacetimidivorans]|uniref:Uncharacterized protein n=1 Tax=Novosphingobium chloroacetimidivorans TaxID=1428314 RepID=A0A7W7KC91_9SPHN|nr:hypothetical protein [Novosphingobium chloroacetimidivorans]MBB4860162.1 hypothetical protein [Novosphingobium chloroacetimidivorans]